MTQIQKTALPASHGSKETALMPAREWRPFTTVRRAVDRLVDDFDRDFWRAPFRRSFADFDFGSVPALPAADVVETGHDYKVSLELPGMAQDDVQATVTNHTLTITGEKKEEKEEKRQDYFLSERRYGSFRRSFELPPGVDTGKVAASFANGVLTVTLPKTAEAARSEKKIAIKAG